jgi:hypothetical protein
MLQYSLAFLKARKIQKGERINQINRHYSKKPR